MLCTEAIELSSYRAFWISTSDVSIAAPDHALKVHLGLSNQVYQLRMDSLSECQTHSTKLTLLHVYAKVLTVQQLVLNIQRLCSNSITMANAYSLAASISWAWQQLFLHTSTC